MFFYLHHIKSTDQVLVVIIAGVVLVVLRPLLTSAWIKNVRYKYNILTSFTFLPGIILMALGKSEHEFLIRFIECKVEYIIIIILRVERCDAMYMFNYIL